MQAALQSKRQELRSSVADGLRGLLQQQQEEEEEGQPGGSASSEEDIWVHHGFLEAYASVRSEVLRLLETVLAGAGLG